jgi:hypothetical protein
MGSLDSYCGLVARMPDMQHVSGSLLDALDLSQQIASGPSNPGL